MNFENLEKKEKDFFNKCFNDMQIIRNDLANALSKKDLQSVDFLAYKHTLCLEIYDLLKCNGGQCGLGYFIKIYGEKENPLFEIFNDYIEKFTEPKLMTSNKLLKLLDKVGV